jgi:anaerobic ribonucleoside-triphosphate reductase activating protein
MLKYVNTAIVFQEIPDETTLAINISNCPCRCPGCHSQFLWRDTGLELSPASLEKLVSGLGGNITCVCFMGGDAEPLAVNELARTVKQHHPEYKVGWYSGRLRLARGVEKTDFDYIKLGPYIAHLGPLNKTTTNQHLYKRMSDNSFKDITSRFWRQQASDN